MRDIYYSDNELSILLSNYQKIGNVEISEMLPRRSAKQVGQKLYEMNLKRTPEVRREIMLKRSGHTRYKKGHTIQNDALEKRRDSMVIKWRVCIKLNDMGIKRSWFKNEKYFTKK